LLDLGLASEQYLALQDRKQREAIQSFEKYWSDWNKVITDQAASAAAVPEFDRGGFAGFTGMAKLHGTPGRPEAILNQSTTAMLRSMLGGNFTQPQLVNAVGGSGGRNVTLNMDPGAIVVNAAPGQSPQDIAGAVRDELAGFFREVAG